MTPKRGRIPFGFVLIGALGACAQPPSPQAPSQPLLPAAGQAAALDANAQAAAEAARRDERQKIMQQYWYENTEAPEGGQRPEPSAPRPLNYPAGSYGGINFGPRAAPDPSLAEPGR